MSKKALAKALTQLGYPVQGYRVQCLPKGSIDKSLTPAEAYARVATDDDGPVLRALEQKEKINRRHLRVLEKALNRSCILELGYVPLPEDASALEIYEKNTKNPDQSTLETLRLSDGKAKADAEKLAKALKEAGFVSLAEEYLPKRIYTDAKTPPGLLMSGFLWEKVPPGRDKWSEAHKALLSAEKQNRQVHQELEVHVPDLKIEDLNYSLASLPDSRTLLQTYTKKVRSPVKSVCDRLNDLDQKLIAAVRAAEAKMLEEVRSKAPREAEAREVAAQKAAKGKLADALHEIGLHEHALIIRSMHSRGFMMFDEAERILRSAFPWNGTPQGYQFWLDAHVKLMTAKLAPAWHEACRADKERLLTALQRAKLSAAFDCLKGKMYEHFSGGMCKVEKLHPSPSAIWLSMGEVTNEKFTSSQREEVFLTLAKQEVEAEILKETLIKACAALGVVSETLQSLKLERFYGEPLDALPSRLLSWTFTWGGTAEGHNFWLDVYNKLVAEQFRDKELLSKKNGPVNMQDVYKTRSGLDVRVLCVDAKGDYPVIALVKSEVVGEDKEEAKSFTAEGKFLRSCDSPRDLVLHEKKEDVFDTTKVDDLVYVRDSIKDAWIKRHYAGKNEAGVPTAYVFGYSSKVGAEVNTWIYWKVNDVEVSPKA